jgi:hypothetical protein
MATNFDLIFEDFDAELQAIEGMIASLLTTGSVITSGRSRVAGANAATLLLAATFEEFVRQSVKALFNTLASSAADITAFPSKVTSTVWRRSLERLARIPFEDVESGSAAITARIGATLSFCIQKDVRADVSDALAHNDNNMRPGELNRLFKQIGINNMCAKACENPALLQELGCDSVGQATGELERRLEDFFRRRNEIAHAIQLNSSSGPTSLQDDISLFRKLARAIAEQCERNRNPPAPDYVAPQVPVAGV